MIIIRSPFRLSLGGGGTDLPSYYTKHNGLLITASINRYMFVSINESATSDKIKLYYSNTEIVNVGDIDKIKHAIIRESLKLHNINRPLEIGSMADIEARTGMGSSSVFAVALLAGLNTLERKFISPHDLAEEACKVEIDLVGKPIGKQDQYATTFGGINQLYIDKKGNVAVTPLKLEKEVIFELENRLLIFYTGITRDADTILEKQSKEMNFDSMHKIKEIGVQIEKALINGNINSFGNLLQEHWAIKQNMLPSMTTDKINDWYSLALSNGALGGKIMGAGGGGFLLLCTKLANRRSVKTVMENQGLKYMDFRFEFEGVKVLTNI